MKRKFSLAYLTIPGTHPVDQIAIAKEAGYDYVSLRPIPMHLPNEPLFQFDKDERLFRDIKEALERHQMKLHDIELARVREDLKVADYESAFEAGAKLGATNVLSSIWTEDREFATENFAKICDLAAQYQLKVNLEFVTFSGVRDLKDSLAILQAVARPNAFVMLDTLHAHRSFVTVEEIAKTDPEKFGFIHLCDGPKEVPSLDDPSMIGVAREGRLYAGEGGADIAGMLKALPVCDVSIELPNALEMNSRGALGHAKRCLETAKEYFARHGIA